MVTATALILLSSVACDPGHGVTVVNESGQSITIYSGGHTEGTLGPGQRKTFTYIKYAGQKLFEAQDEDGDVLFSEELTWQELRERRWRIVITSSQ